MLIRIVFVIFIANGIDCLGSVCDNCCECFKIKEYEEIEGNKEKNKNEKIKEYEEIKKDENITAESLVNIGWYESKKENLVLKIFKKKEDKAFTSKDNGDKISIKLEKNNNPKITYQKEAEDEPNLGGKKYAFFEIKTKTNKTIYLYCSDVESSGTKYNVYGIFQETNHVSISVIACDTENVKNMAWMFFQCSGLTELDLKNFNTTNVMYIRSMFSLCNSLKKLNIKNFNTENVTDMQYMFSGCSSLTELDLKNFNTTNVTDMRYMFYGCSELKKINFGQNFNTSNVTNMNNMFDWCSSFPEDIRNKLNNVEGIIDFFKEKNN